MIFGKKDLNIISLRHYAWLMLLCTLHFAYAANNANNDDITLQLLKCRGQSSVALRLVCYDQISLTSLTKSPIALTNIKEPKSMPNNDIKRSSVSLKAIELERRRTTQNSNFLVMQNLGDISPEIIITAVSSVVINDDVAPPILVFSCVDKITRLQIVLFAPVNYPASSLVLKMNNERLKTDWFIRDGGYLLEYSRGLLGVNLIKKLMQNDILVIEHEGGTLNGATFNLTNLAQEIVPLRKACAW